MGLILKAINWQGWLGLGLTLALSIYAGIQLHNSHHWHKQSDHFEQLYHQEHLAFGQTVLNYRQAAEQAREADAKNKARAEAEQRAVVARTKADYETRIARARATADSLRHAPTGANSGSSGTAPVSNPGSAGPAAPSASADHGLSIDERLVATEQAIQLDALIDYVEGVLKVDLNGTPSHPSR